MYARQPPQGRFPRPIQLPNNYSGNAFSTEPQEPQEPPEYPIELQDSKETEEAKEKAEATEKGEASLSTGKLFPSPGFRLDLGRLFRSDRGAGLGMEDLLLIGLILLISQGETKDDLLLLLLLLLFIQ